MKKTTEPRFLIEDVLALGLVVSKNSGFISAKQAATSGQFSTATEVAMIISGDTNSLRVNESEVRDVMPVVMSLIDFVDEMEYPNNSFREYVAELKVKFFVGEISLKKISLVISVIGLYLKAQKEKLEKPTDSKWLGIEDSKINVVAQVSDIRTINTRYGTSKIVTAPTADGGTIVWFASGDTSKIVVGISYKVEARVKSLTEYKGIKQTVVSRPKFTEITA